MDPTKKELYTAKRPSGVNTDDSTIASAWSDVRSDATSTNWVILHLSSPTVVAVKATGSEGIPELISNLSDDEILFCGIRLASGDQVKFFHVYFVGANVGALKKGKASMFESGVFAALDGAHGKLSFSTGLAECTVESFAEQLFKLSQLRFAL